MLIKEKKMKGGKNADVKGEKGKEKKKNKQMTS